MTKEEKESIKDIKKTAEAQETMDESAALEKAKDAKKSTEKMIDTEVKKETAKEEKDKEEAVKKMVKEETKVVDTRRMTREERRKAEEREALQKWVPKTKLGEEARAGKIKDLDVVLKNGQKILESEIIDMITPVKTDLISIGQAKGKFGGGKRRAFRQTQRKTKEGNVPTFSTMAVVGDGKGHVGIGAGRAKETLPARDKATRKAKISMIRVKRACSGFDCACSELHTVPFQVEGKAGSVRVTIIPAPQGTGLVAGNEMKKILSLAGIKDVYTQIKGRKRTSFNLAKATIDALTKTTRRESL